MSTHQIMNIAIVGNAPDDKCDMLNEFVNAEGINDLCTLSLYGADGQPDAETLSSALAHKQNGKINAIVTLPLEKPLNEMLAEAVPEGNISLPIYIMENLPKISITNANKSAEEIEAMIKQICAILQHHFFIRRPRIAVVAAQPSEGAEDEPSAVTSAIESINKEHIVAFGPLDSKNAFMPANTSAYDLILCFVEGNENSLISQKDAIECRIVNDDTFVVQTPYNKLSNAVFNAIDAVRNKHKYEQPFANPLPKLYHERREDGDKARFAVKKKGGFNPAEHRRENVKYTTQKSAPKQD